MALLPATTKTCRLGVSFTTVLRCYHPRTTMSEEELCTAFHTPEGKPRVLGRPYLPGALGPNMPDTLRGPTEHLPYIVRMTDVSQGGVTDGLVSSVKTVLQKQLPRFGAVLLRDLPMKSASDFSDFNKKLGLASMPYVGGLGVRESVDARVMTASREPPAYTLEPHNEMSYHVSTWPKYLSFFCEVPPSPGRGGESTLTPNKDLLRDLDPNVREKFTRLGIRYVQYLPAETSDGYLSWQEVFKTPDKSVAEDRIRTQGYDLEWQSDGALFYWCHNPATRPHHTTGEEVWFNQGHMNATYYRAHPFWGQLVDVPDEKMPNHTYYGDGTDIEPEVLQHIRDITWKNTIGVQLQKGDLLFLDNMAVQHGRMGFVGQRRLLVNLTEDKIE